MFTSNHGKLFSFLQRWDSYFLRNVVYLLLPAPPVCKWKSFKSITALWRITRPRRGAGWGRIIFGRCFIHGAVRNRRRGNAASGSRLASVSLGVIMAAALFRPLNEARRHADTFRRPSTAGVHVLRFSWSGMKRSSRKTAAALLARRRGLNGFSLFGRYQTLFCRNSFFSLNRLIKRDEGNPKCGFSEIKDEFSLSFTAIPFQNKIAVAAMTAQTSSDQWGEGNRVTWDKTVISVLLKVRFLKSFHSETVDRFRGDWYRYQYWHQLRYCLLWHLSAL